MSDYMRAGVSGLMALPVLCFLIKLHSFSINNTITALDDSIAEEIQSAAGIYIVSPKKTRHLTLAHNFTKY